MKKLLLFCSLLTALGLQAQTFWTEVGPFSNNSGYFAKQISIVNANVVWVWGQNLPGTAGFSQQYSISTDGGITWTQGNINNNVSTTVTSLEAVSATTAYASTATVGLSGTSEILKTTDSGATWIPLSLNAPNTIFPNFIHFFDSNHGIVVSDPESGNFQIFTTADAGDNWTAVADTNLPEAMVDEYGYSLNFRSKANTIWFSTNKGRIYKSTDMGATWSVSQSPLQDFGSASANGSYDFKTESEGILISGDFAFYRTTDAGNTWMPEFPSTPFRNYDTVFVTGTSNTYFSLGAASETNLRGSSYSTDGGLNWIDLNNVDSDPVIPTTVKFASGTVGFCIGSYASEIPNSTVRFFRLTDPLNRLLKSNAFAKTTFSAIPNPTNGIVKISGANIVSIAVFDVSGKIMLTKNFNGLAEVNLDVSRFENGIYFAKITDNNGTSSTLKIVKQ